MNNQYYGCGYALMNNDIIETLCKSLALPLGYIPMTTPPRSKNRDDSKMTNYRLGNLNEQLSVLMRASYSGDTSNMTEVFDYFQLKGIEIKMIASEENDKAGCLFIANTPHFTHKDRAKYFEESSYLTISSGQQILFLDPDAGIAPIGQEVPRIKGASLITIAEIKMLMGKVTEDSVVVIQQSINNPFYKHEQRIAELRNELAANVILLVDEVIQSGVIVGVKNEAVYRAVLGHLENYLAAYKGLKNSNRILLGYCEGENVFFKTANSKSAAE